MTTVDKLRQVALEIRRLIIEFACRSKCAHVGSSLSCVEILTALYFKEMNLTKTKSCREPDHFILSKGHAELALYATLVKKRIMSKKMLEGFMQQDGTLPAHLDRFTGRGIEVSSGSLGHGFNIALGWAWGNKLRKKGGRFFVLIGDGESQEGSIWEGAMFASRLGIDNLTVILDNNNLQGYGRANELCFFEPIDQKWKAFGWQVHRVDGHNFSQINSALASPNRNSPKIIIAKTVKGKGVSFMEDQMKWHYFIVTPELKEKALKELSLYSYAHKNYK